MNELILCALRRRGRPGTAAQLYDEAIALAQDAHWPRGAWAGHSVQKVAAVLRGLAGRKIVRQADIVKENGMPRPPWEPTDGWDAHAAIPALPRIAREAAPAKPGMVGEMIEVNFENDTITFKMQPGYYACAGRFRFTPEPSE